MKKTIVVTDCGHQFKTGYTADVLIGCTMDCKMCGEPIIFLRDTTIGRCVRGRNFHHYLNEHDPGWPLDGAGTGWVEMSAMKAAASVIQEEIRHGFRCGGFSGRA